MISNEFKQSFPNGVNIIRSNIEDIDINLNRKRIVKPISDAEGQK